MDTSYRPVWSTRAGALLVVCGRCQPGTGEAWVRRLRTRLHSTLGGSAVTVTVSGCVGACPSKQVAVMLTSPGRGCWDGTVDPNDPDRQIRLSALVSHPPVGVPLSGGSCVRVNRGTRALPAQDQPATS